MLHEEFLLITVHFPTEKREPELAAACLFKHMQSLHLKVHANEASGEACDPRNCAVNPYFEHLNPENIPKTRKHPKPLSESPFVHAPKFFVSPTFFSVCTKFTKWMIPAIKFMGKDLNPILIS
jgi:hypothetical protein